MATENQNLRAGEQVNPRVVGFLGRSMRGLDWDGLFSRSTVYLGGLHGVGTSEEAEDNLKMSEKFPVSMRRKFSNRGVT